MTTPARVGLLFWSQTADWPALRDAAARADAAGVSGIWTWDHLMPIVGPWEGPILEGWSVLAGLAQVTARATLGLMVGANTFRNPGLTAKLVTTLDHLSGGRAILGIGGAWWEREHEAYGIDFGTGFGERLDRLDESVMLIRRLLDGERIADHAGPVYRMHEALINPLPVQARLPIMIGGTGPTKTLRTLARYGDQWNAMGRPDRLAESDAILRRRCEEVGRDHTEIERSTLVEIVIRSSRAEALAAYAERCAQLGMRYDERRPLAGSPEEIREQAQPYFDIGFRHFIAAAPAPQDLETIDRVGELIAVLNA
ncbi:MAG: LLM class flavin-dependent oxidoreductase [Chloroflexota bacterium]